MIKLFKKKPVVNVVEDLAVIDSKPFTKPVSTVAPVVVEETVEETVESVSDIFDVEYEFMLKADLIEFAKRVIVETEIDIDLDLNKSPLLLAIDEALDSFEDKE